MLLHGLEERRLRLGRRAVDFVGQHHVREDRSRLELEERAAVRVFLHDVRADDVGRHQVRRELNARELQVQDVGERVHEAGLADAGNAFEEHMAAGQQRRDRARHDFLVADDALSDFVRDPGEFFAKLIDVLGDGRNSHHFRMK